MRLVARVRRAGRRVLAVPAVRGRAVALADRFPVLRSAGNAVLGPTQGTRRARTVDIRPGRMVTGETQGRRLPVVVVVAVGLGPGDAERLAAAIERAQLTTGTFRPLAVIDTGDLGAFRARGYAVEAVMSESVFARVNPHEAWSEYLFERVTVIASGYGARSVVPVDPASLDRLPDHVLRLVGATGR